MEVNYKSKKLEKICNSEREGIKALGPEIAKKLRQRLYEMYAADNLSDLNHLPPTRCHQLENNRAGQFAVDLKHPFRLVFEPYNEPLPMKEDGGIDLARVTAILILEVEDYHGK